MLSAVADHDDAVGRARAVPRIPTRRRRSPTPVRGDVAQDRVDRGARADVDALGRLVEDQHLRLQQQPARDDDLLLHAAGEVQHVRHRAAGRPAGRGAPAARRPSCRAAVAEAEAAMRAEMRRAAGSRARKGPARCSGGAGPRRRSRCRRGSPRPGCAARTALPVERISPPARGRRPKIVSTVSERPAPTRPPRPRISPRCRSKDTSRTIGGARELRRPREHRLAARRRRRGGRAIDRAEFAADHQADEFRLVQARGRARGRDRAALAHDRDSVGDREHFLQPMRDEDQRAPGARAAAP